MGEKRRKPDWYCNYSCGGKGFLDELRELEYVFESKIGEVITCPKCGAEQMVK